MRKILFTIYSLISLSFAYSFAYAGIKEQKETFWGYKQSQTISIDQYLQMEKSSNKWSSLKLNSNGDVTYKGKVIITQIGTPINDFNSHDSYLWLKIYMIAKGTKPKEGCDEKDTIKNGVYGIGCYVDTQEEVYKTEIENAINEDIESIKKFIAKDVIRAQEIYKEGLKAKKKNENIQDNIFMLQDYQRGIEEHEIMFLSKLIDITVSFNNVNNKIPSTDNSKALLQFLYPYFKQANINYQKIEELDKYTTQKSKEIENLIQKM